MENKFEEVNQYEEALNELMGTEVYMEYGYGEDETGLDKCIFAEVDKLKERGDTLYGLIDKVMSPEYKNAIETLFHYAKDTEHEEELCKCYELLESIYE